MPVKMDLSGQIYGRLVVVSEAETVGPKTMWLCRCECGAEITVRSNNLRTGNTTSCGCLRREVHAETGQRSRRWQEDVKYAAAHIRIGKERGSANGHPCVDCGKPACDWSYEGGDPDEKVEIINNYPRRFSLDVARYSPRCRPCHRKKDIAESREQMPS